MPPPVTGAVPSLPGTGFLFEVRALGHPLIDEFCRAKSLSGMRPEFFHKCQRVFRDEVNPALDENAALKARVAELEAKLEGKRKKAEPEAVSA